MTSVDKSPPLDLPAPGKPSLTRRMLIYLLFVVIPVLGAALAMIATAGSAAPATAAHEIGEDFAARLLIAVAVVVVVAMLGGWLAKQARQPPVIGEILAGLALGPSLLGALWPTGQEWLFPSTVYPVLSGLAEIGLAILMFLTGAEIDSTALRRDRYVAGTLAQASLAGPFFGGVLLAIWLYPSWSGSNASPIVFQLFLACALSITALPVLARILQAKAMTNTRVGQLSLTVAAIGDVSTWCLVAVIVAIAGHTPGTAVRTALLTVAFCVVLLRTGRSAITRVFVLLDRRQAPAAAHTAVILLGLVVCASTTAAIGITPIFGAFVFGAVCPSHPAAQAVADQLARYACPVLLPFFFLKTGLGMQVPNSGLGAALLTTTTAVLVVAVASKAVGVYAVARAAALGRETAARLAILLNARGLTELVLLDLGRRLGIIGDHLFTVLLIVTLLTTCATAPLLDLLDRLAHWRRVRVRPTHS